MLSLEGGEVLFSSLLLLLFDSDFLHFRIGGGGQLSLIGGGSLSDEATAGTEGMLPLIPPLKSAACKKLGEAKAAAEVNNPKL